jgi:hypothetical protein
VFLGDEAALIVKIWKICVNKFTKIYSGRGVASKNFRDTRANSSLSPVDFSKIGKFTSLSIIFYSKYIFMRFCKYIYS